jgi:hypothetical protein
MPGLYCILSVINIALSLGILYNFQIVELMVGNWSAQRLGEWNDAHVKFD